MQRINLLRDETLLATATHEPALHGRRARAACWIAVFAWIGAAALHARSLDTEIARFRACLEASRQSEKDLDRLRKEREDLASQRRWLERVCAGAPAACVLDDLCRVLPAEIALTKFVLAQPQERAGERAKTESDARPVSSYDVRMEGIAVGNAELAETLQRLAADARFRAVRLIESNATDAEETAVRRFVMTAMAVPLAAGGAR